MAADTADIKPAPSAEEISGWIKDLDSNKFAERDQATNKLIEAGPAGIDEVTKAAESDSKEVSRRSIEILQRLMQSDDAAIKDKAKAALTKLTTSSIESVAGRASQALKPPTPVAPNGQPGRIIIGGMRIGGVPMNRTIKVQNVNGRRTIEINENGKKTEIVDDPTNGIEMQTTEKVDGKEKTEKITAKNLEELKKNHPEAAKVLEQFQGGAGGAIQIQVHAGGMPGGVPIAIPMPARAMMPGFLPPGVQPQHVAEPIGDARKRLAETTEQLKKQAADNADLRAALEKSIEQLEAADKKLQEAEQKLGK
jgi:hypothetical protein